jgi:thiol-disulfide isomerase/thioredoxin
MGQPGHQPLEAAMLNAPAPELTQALEWINCAPVTLGALRGQVTLVAFWSAGSAYCENMLDDLRQLQVKFVGALQVIAIHVPKFEAERNPQFVRNACNRLGVGVRVAHDPAFVAWQHYGVTAWPTVAVIDRTGVLREVLVGDRQREALEKVVVNLIGGDGSQEFVGQPPPLRGAGPDTPLAFPSGICASERVLYIADTGHHSVVECNHEGRLLRRIGSNTSGFMDGQGSATAFLRPRGLALGRDAVYVCDTGNHALRRIRIVDGDVQTLAGNGRPGQPVDGAAGAGRTVSLNQPWSVALSEDRAFITLAGCNQIWAFDRVQSRLVHVAGSGALALVDGDGRESAFAQPAGIALVHALLYVTDSGASAVRSLQIGSGKVQTLLGHGLFEFGDVIGSRADARLQYPLAIAKDPDTAHLWILDSYNNAIRKLKLGGGEVTRFDVSHKLEFPTAMALSGSSLWIANTNAHEILRVDTSNGSVRRLPIGE